MNNKVDYFIHKSFEPTYYQRKFENDLPKELEEKTVTQKARRVLLIALPFLSLYRPVAGLLSLSMGAMRLSTKTIEVFTAQTWPQRAHQIAQFSLAAFAIIGSLYNFTLGLYVTTGADLIGSIVSCIQALSEQEYRQAFSELVQTLSSTLYLGIMTHGSLEIVIASILLQGSLSFYEAYGQWDGDHLPEALGKMIMGMVRLYQSNTQYQLLLRQSELLKRFEQLAPGIQKSRDIDHLWGHAAIKKSLSNNLNSPAFEGQSLTGTSTVQPNFGKDSGSSFDLEGQILVDANGLEYDFGANQFGVGKQLVKGMNVNFKETEDKKILQFKINHFFREKLEERVSEIQHAENDDLNDLLSLFGSRVSAIHISEKDSEILGATNWDIQLEGLGHLYFGKEDLVHTLHSRITVEMNAGTNLYDMHEALAFMGLEDALRTSAKEDFDRMKLGYLFHLFSPKEATLFVREADYFDLPIDQFKEAILQRSPEMDAIFTRWLDRLAYRETLPGKMRLSLEGLGKAAADEGAWGLTSALMGAWEDDEVIERMGSILKMGMISSESRNTTGISASGLSWGVDYYTGGADSVFTQMVTDKNHSFDDFAYQSDLRIHFSPAVLDLGTYQFHSDNFGLRNPAFDSIWWGESYLDRPELFDFIRNERKHFRCDHEVMVKDRIPPHLITGISVENQALKDSLLESFRQKEIIQLDANGKETILGKLAEQFIWVGNEVHKEQFC